MEKNPSESESAIGVLSWWKIFLMNMVYTIGSMYVIFIPTFTIKNTQMWVFITIPCMDPMARCKSTDSVNNCSWWLTVNPIDACTTWGRVVSFFPTRLTRWWFQTFFIFTPIWGRFPFLLIFLRWVETTNQLRLCYKLSSKYIHFWTDSTRSSFFRFGEFVQP